MPEVAPVVAMLSNTIALRQGVVVQDGSFEEDLTISLLPDQGIRIEQSTNAQASGTLDEKSIELSPITSKLDATIALDGKPLGDDPMKELRRLLALTMDVRSAFVNVNATGNAGGLSAKTSFDLNKAREQLGQFIDFGGLYTSGTGTLNFDITGDLADKSKPITFKVTSDASNLTVTKNEQAFLKNEVLKFTTEGDALLATNETNVILRTLSLDTGSKLANINKVGNEPAKIVMKNGVVGGTGAFHVTADVARLAALSGNKGDESTKLESGFFDGTLTLASITEKRQYEIKLDGALTKVTLGEKLSNENVKLVGRFYAPDDMSKLSAWLDIYSSFGSIKITDTHVNLSKPDGTPLPTLEMLDTINVSGSSDQLAKVNALLLGLGAGDSSDVPPAKVESGKIAFGLVAKRNASDGSIDLKLDVPAISDLRVTRDGQRFAPNTPASASVKATVQIDPNKPDDVVASIKKIIVDSLDVNSFGIASIKMTEPIAITDPMGAPSAKGAVDVKGDLESLDKMLVVLTGSKSNELAGQANLNVKFASNDGAIRLTSAGQIDNFRSLSETGTKLAPQTLTLAGDINLDPTKQTAKINRFDLKTSDEQTLVMSMKGGITDWSKTQQLQGVELNLAYSMERLWKLVAPLVDPKGELQIEAVEGDFKDQIFKLSGNLSDMKTLNGGGKLKLARVYASGIDTRDIDLWITVKNGIVRF
ncbi:MAG TPA: hypothetical protein PK402_09085, partial [Tepidisphaeraceae bacterium]|nr:hypothetical protein [Tepidisphaeraceae bacterium]